MEKLMFLSAAGLMAAGGAASAVVPEKSSKIRGLALVPATATLAAALIYRWYLTGHAPVFGTFETSSSEALACLIVGIVLAFKKPNLKWIQPLAALFALGMMVFGMRFTAKHYPLTISETSLWVDFHAIAAWATYGLYACSTACAIGILFGKGGEDGEKTAYRLAEVGFLFQSLLLLTGSYYASILFGMAWQWDVVEVGALLSWIVYGFVIHLRLLFGYGGKRLSAWLIIAFISIIVTYKLPAFLWGMTYHFFDLNL